jgi:hypothetical protein
LEIFGGQLIFSLAFAAKKQIEIMTTIVNPRSQGARLHALAGEYPDKSNSITRKNTISMVLSRTLIAPASAPANATRKLPTAIGKPVETFFN